MSTLPTPTTTTSKGTKTTRQLYELTCVPECGAMFRDHNQNALVQEAMVHGRVVHPDMKFTEPQLSSMIRKL